MYEWLTLEIARIKTPKFHVVSGPADPKLCEAIEQSHLELPPSYELFLKQFRSAKLYRRRSYYYIEIYSVPEIVDVPQHGKLLLFGKTINSLAYFKCSLLKRGYEPPVFEWYHNVGLRKTSKTFDRWLRSKSQAARRTFQAREWHTIEKGPRPFNEFEMQIVSARRQFLWHQVGISYTGNLKIEVENRSNVILPYLQSEFGSKIQKPKKDAFG